MVAPMNMAPDMGLRGVPHLSAFARARNFGAPWPEVQWQLSMEGRGRRVGGGTLARNARFEERPGEVHSLGKCGESTGLGRGVGCSLAPSLPFACRRNLQRQPGACGGPPARAHQRGLRRDNSAFPPWLRPKAELAG